MVNWAAVLAVFSVYCAGVVIPGPNFVAVAHKAASSTITEAFMLVAGIVVVNLFWATCAILGIGMVFTLLPWLAVVIKFLGAAYLIWFGARLIVLRGAGLNSAPGAPAVTRRKAFLQGVATNIANPKSIAFYAAIFSAAAPPHVSIETFAAMLAVVAIVASLWYGFVAMALSHRRVADAYRKQKRWIDSVCGSVIILLGVRQMLR